MIRKTKAVRIFNLDVYLSERDTYDVLMLPSIKIEGSNNLKVLYELALVLEASLRPYVRSIKWYQIKKQLICRYKFRLKYLIRHLSVNTELSEYVLDVYRLEGIDVDNLMELEKKKMTGGLITN